jgi:DNA-binding transcriptional LysR family regulator
LPKRAASARRATATNSDHVISAVRYGAADLGFIESPAVARGLRSRVVARNELVVIVPPEHKWTRRSRAVNASELSQTPLVTREPGSGKGDGCVACHLRVRSCRSGVLSLEQYEQPCEGGQHD